MYWIDQFSDGLSIEYNSLVYSKLRLREFVVFVGGGYFEKKKKKKRKCSKRYEKRLKSVYETFL